MLDLDAAQFARACGVNRCAVPNGDVADRCTDEPSLRAAASKQAPLAGAPIQKHRAAGTVESRVAIAFVDGGRHGEVAIDA